MPREGETKVLESVVHEVSVVVPLYQGARTIEALVSEIEPLTASAKTPAGRAFRVSEVLLVHDGAVDDSATHAMPEPETSPAMALLLPGSPQRIVYQRAASEPELGGATRVFVRTMVLKPRVARH